MEKKRVLLIGAGRRILQNVLPVFEAMDDLYEVAAIYTRTLEEGGGSRELRPITELSSLEDIDLVHVAVDKDSIPQALETLAGLDPARTELLIDTPVLRFRHFLHLKWLERMRAIWVPEDCATLPWIPVVRRAIAAGAIGELHTLHFDRSGYAYHGLATAKALTGAKRVTSGRRVRVGAGRFERRLRLSSGHSAIFVEPRDYLRGHLRLIGSRGVITDTHERAPGDLRIQLQIEAGACRAIRVGDFVEHLSDAEAALTLPVGDEETALAGILPPDASIIARQGMLKRVGLLRLLRDLHAGRGAYPLSDGVDDMVCDYYLEKLGYWWDTPLTSPRSGPARLLYRSLSYLGG